MDSNSCYSPILSLYLQQQKLSRMSNREYHPEVAQAIEEYFRSMGLTQVMAAQLLGVTPQAVSLQLKQPFGKNVSSKWSRKFGFNRDFLMTGDGELLDKPTLTRREQQAYDAANRELANIEEEKKEEEANYQADPIPKELTNEEDNYRKIDIYSFIAESKWESNMDYNLALEIAEICRTQMSDLENEIAYLTQECERLTQEKKKLFLENAALRRSANNQ